MIGLVEKHGKKARLSKGQFLFKQGDIDSNFYVVRKGLLKVFYTTSEGKEFVKSFIDQGNCIASISAILKSGPCPYSIIALEESALLRVPGDFMLNMKDRSLEGLEYINKILIDLALKKEKREYEFLCHTAEERYIDFLKEYPNLESRVSQYDIARYLGITNVALSRIRKRVQLY